jgi:hypothetical protein
MSEVASQAVNEAWLTSFPGHMIVIWNRASELARIVACLPP